MAEDNSSGTFEMRRQARGTERSAKTRSWRGRLMFWGALAVLGVGIGVSVFVWFTVTRVRTVTARVRASVVALSPKVDARLLALNVKDGDRVTADQVVARLDDTELRAALEASKANETILLSRHAQAVAAAELAEAQVMTDIARAKTLVGVAEARAAAAEAAIREQTTRLSGEIKRGEARVNEAKALLKRLQTGAREEDVQAAEARLASSRATQKLYELEVRQSEQLVGEGIDSQHILEVRKTRLNTQQNAVREAELELKQLNAGPTREELAVGEETLKARQAELAVVQAGEIVLESLRADLAIRQAEVDQARAELAQAEAQEANVTIATERVKAAEAELRKAQAEVAGRTAALQGMEIVTPVPGIVTRTFDDVGEVCRKGVPSILVSDDSKARWIEGFIREEDAMRVSVGQKAKVKVPATTGRWTEAEVTQIGMHTLSLDRAGGVAAADSAGSGRPDRVWVKLSTSAPLEGDPVTGTSARVVIYVR